MKSRALAARNLRELIRDPLSVGLTLALPLLIYVVLRALGSAIGDENAPALTAAALVPGAVLFGLAMLMFMAATLISRDRESALFSRLLTTPLSANQFAAAYALPYLPVAVVQIAAVLIAGVLIGLDLGSGTGIALGVLGLMAVFYVACGIILGSLLTVNQVSAGYTVILLLTIFGGAWFDLSEIGGTFQTVGDAFPFAHAIDAVKAAMIDGGGISDVASDVYWVIGYTAVVVVVAVVVFRSRMVE